MVASLDAGAFALIGLATVVGGLIRGFAGFGGALVLVMVLSIVVGPQAAVPIAALSGLPAMFQLLPAAWSSERAFVVPFGLAAFVAAPIGTAVLLAIEPALMKIAIAVLVMAMVLMLYRNWKPAAVLGPVASAAAGASAGLIQGSAGGGGPPAVAIALARPGVAQQQRA